MKIHVRLFAILRERAGLPDLMLDVQDRATVSQTMDSLLEQLPELKPHTRSLAFAVNRVYAAESTVLREGDELALIPPVSGG